jgi:hypothetical protein
MKSMGATYKCRCDYVSFYIYLNRGMEWRSEGGEPLAGSSSLWELQWCREVWGAGERCGTEERVFMGGGGREEAGMQ